MHKFRYGSHQLRAQHTHFNFLNTTDASLIVGSFHRLLLETFEQALSFDIPVDLVFGRRRIFPRAFAFPRRWLTVKRVIQVSFDGCKSVLCMGRRGCRGSLIQSGCFRPEGFRHFMRRCWRESRTFCVVIHITVIILLLFFFFLFFAIILQQQVRATKFPCSVSCHVYQTLVAMTNTNAGIVVSQETGVYADEKTPCILVS